MRKPIFFVVAALISLGVFWYISTSDSSKEANLGLQPDLGTDAIKAGAGLDEGARQPKEVSASNDSDVTNDAVGGTGITSSNGRNLRPPSVTESMLVSSESLRSSQIQAFIETDTFYTVLDKLMQESDADTLEMTNLFGDGLKSEFAKSEQFSLSRIACGSRSCMAVVLGRVGDDMQFAKTFSGRQSGPKAYSAIQQLMPQPTPEGLYEYRIVFATDPAMNKIQVP